MRSTTVTRRAETDHRSCSGGPAPGPRSMLPSRLCGSLPADPSLTPTGPHEPPSGQPRSPCFTLHPGANRLLLAPTDLMVGVLSACYTRRPQGVTHGQSRCTVLSVRRRVGRDPPQIPKLTVGVRFPSPAPSSRRTSAAKNAARAALGPFRSSCHPRHSARPSPAPQTRSSSCTGSAFGDAPIRALSRVQVDRRSPHVVVAHPLQIPDRRARNLRRQMVAGVPQVVKVKIRNSDRLHPRPSSR